MAYFSAPPVADFGWADLTAEGETDMGKALQLVAEQLKMPPMSERALPPVLVLISDGQPTDDFESGLKALMEQPWGKKAVRIAISIGQDADPEVLQKFIGNTELKPLAANSPEALVKHIKWSSTAVLNHILRRRAVLTRRLAPPTESVPIPTAAPPRSTARAPPGPQSGDAADNQKTTTMSGKSAHDGHS